VIEDQFFDFELHHGSAPISAAELAGSILATIFFHDIL
jgi:hypothetical protein